MLRSLGRLSIIANWVSGLNGKFTGTISRAICWIALRGYGFEIDPCEAFVVHDLAKWKAECAFAPDLPGGKPWSRWTSSGAVASEIFKKDYQLTASELAAGIRSGSTQHRGYIAYAGDEPAGVGRLYTHPLSAFGGLFGGGTRAAYRSRGVYRALVAARAQDALELGAQYLSVDALPTSQPILKRMGFERIIDIWAVHLAAVEKLRQREPLSNTCHFPAVFGPLHGVSIGFHPRSQQFVRLD